MKPNTFDQVILQYNERRKKALNDLENRKKKLYKKVPRLEEIEEEINRISINKTKNILLHSLTNILTTEYENKLFKLKLEKETILKAENISDDFFRPYFQCKKCNDTGYIKYENKKTQMCSCLKQELINISYNNSNLNNLKKETFKNFDLSKFSDEINFKKYKMNFSPRQNIEKIKEASQLFIKNFDKESTKNLFFTGNTGLGKTYMTNCIANELLKKGKTVLYQTAPVLLENVIDSKFSKYKNSDSDGFYNQVLETDLLIIDDLGAEVPNSMKLSELFTILNARCLNLNNRFTRTIISTNLSIEKVFKQYEERIGSRIAGFYDIYYFFGEDLRMIK